MTPALKWQRTIAATALLAMGAIIGCSRAPVTPPRTDAQPAAAAGHDHDHDHDHGHGDHAPPKTVAEGVKRLTEAAASVKKHLAADARADADTAVHDMGHLLEDMQEFVRTSDLAADAKAAATKALDDLFDCFGTLDEALHAEPGTGTPAAEVHASVATRIEAAIGALEAAGATPAGGSKDPDAKATEPKDAAGEDPVAAIIREAAEKK